MVKRYVREPSSGDVARWLREARPATSRLAWVEIASSVARRVREGTVTPSQAARVVRALERDASSLLVLELTPACGRLARSLCARRGLRAGDAIHLAAALDLRDRSARPVEFVCFDAALTLAAVAEGLPVLPAP